MTHIRRHDDERWSRHAEGCEFDREPEEQLAITASYRRSKQRPFRLARRFEPLFTSALKREFKATSQASRRPGLANLLAHLVTDAGLQAVPFGWSPPPVPDQAAMLWKAARAMALDEGIRVTDFLCTSALQLPAFTKRIQAVDPQTFKHTRPHGILLVRLSGIGKGTIQPVAGPELAVSGKLSVFGESAEDAKRARAPYLAVCLVSGVADDGPVGIVSAYVHPCASTTHFMLVDSGAERQTLAHLRRVQGWLKRDDGIEAAIEKPLFDIGPETGPEVQPRPVCIPDFIVRGGERTAVVETMGYADGGYRTPEGSGACGIVRSNSRSAGGGA